MHSGTCCHSSSGLRRQLFERAAQVFGAPTMTEAPPVQFKTLHAKIGPLALENDSLEAALSKAGLRSAKR